MEPTVWKFQAGVFVEIRDLSIKARIDQRVAPVHGEEEATEVHTSDAVVIALSNDVRGQFHLPFRVQALSRVIDNAGKTLIDRLDDRPGEPGLDFRLEDPTFPTCSVRHDTVLPGAATTVDAQQLVRNSGARVDFDVETVANGTTDAEGKVSVLFTVPTDAAQGLHVITVANEGTAVTANCSVTVLAQSPYLGPR